MRYPCPRRRPLSVECLEHRAVPATLQATLQNGVLRILGTPADDVVVVRQFDRTIAVDGVANQFPALQVNRLVIDTGAGNDTIRLDSQNFPGQTALTAPATVYGGDGNDTIAGTNRGDQIYGQGGNDAITGGAARDYINGG